MFCTQCGRQIPDDATFCSSCGSKNTLNKTNITTHEMDEVAEIKNVSNANKVKGILWLTLPLASIILIGIIWTIASYILAINNLDETSSIGNLMNIALGFLGVIGVIAVIVGIPLGLIYLNKKESIQNSRYDARSGKGDASVVPKEIKKWHWGAFTLSLIWGLWNNVWISLLLLVPLLNLVILVMLGIKGNEWAWRKKRWESIEQFQRVQHKWSMWGIGILVFKITVIILPILIALLSGQS